MPPTTSRDFFRAASQRMVVAEFLSVSGFTLEAQYLGGYVIECSLKSVVMEQTPAGRRPAKLRAITISAMMHQPEVLLGELRKVGVVLPPELALRMRKLSRFGWSTDLRYEVGRLDTGETRALLKTAGTVLGWAEGVIT